MRAESKQYSSMRVERSFGYLCCVTLFVKCAIMYFECIFKK
jgi:hypothetical protein